MGEVSVENGILRPAMALAMLLSGTCLAMADGSPEMAQVAGRYLAKASHGALENVLLDYPSARFRKVYPHIYEAEPGKQFWYLCGQVNAKNALGGYTGWEGFLITPEEHNQIAVFVGTDGPYDAATNVREWVNLCGGDGLAAKNTEYGQVDYAGEMAFHPKREKIGQGR